MLMILLNHFMFPLMILMFILMFNFAIARKTILINISCWLEFSASISSSMEIKMVTKLRSEVFPRRMLSNYCQKITHTVSNVACVQP